MSDQVSMLHAIIAYYESIEAWHMAEILINQLKGMAK